MSQKPTGLKMPSKIGRPTGLPHPKASTGIPAKAQCAIEKSARAAGLPIGVAEKYAADLLQRYAAPDLEPSPQPLDDYKIGDYVYVGGTKGGRIAFIGETQFAPGEWAGVVLDEPVGKNDGSVAGVHYFQCEMKRGVFSRIGKLSKKPIPGGIKSTPIATPAVTPGNVATMPPTPNQAQETPKPRPSANGMASQPKTVHTTPKTGLARQGNMSGSQTSLKASPSGSNTNLLETRYNLKVGDRVLVSGTKPGVLRYMGVTDFANGHWVGVELDDPMGKNDGTVAGKRYFECKPLYGLFAPVHKVTKATGIMATPVRRSSISKLGLGMSLSRERSGSQDSISSISSVTSNTSRSARPKTMGRPSSGTTSQHGAMQKALKEKEEHVEQLLRERDLERSELTKCASQCDEAEAALMTFKTEHEHFVAESEGNVNSLSSIVEKLEQQKQELVNQVEEERRKVEDLQFAVEEESICKVEIETQSEHDQEKMKTLYDNLEDKSTRIKELEKELQLIKSEFDGEKTKVSEAMDSTDYYFDRIEELTHKLSQAEKKVKEFESEKQQAGAKADEVDDALKQKTERIVMLEDQLAATTEQYTSLEIQLLELQEEFQEKEKKHQKQQNTIDELMQKVATSDSSSSTLSAEVQQLKSQLSDLQRQLQASEDRAKNLEEDKGKLEHQIEELMHHSGDSSEQLSMLGDQLRDRDRKLAELQGALSTSTQRIGELTEKVEREREAGEREVEMMTTKHQEDLKMQNDQIEELQNELDKSNQKLIKMKEKSEQDRLSLQTKKDAELNDLRDQLTKKEEEAKVKGQEVKSHKEALQKLQMENEEAKFEGDKLEKIQKKLESEVKSLSSERDQLVNERDQLLSEQKDVLSQQGSSHDQLQKITQEKEHAVEKVKQLHTEQATAEVERQKLSAERDSLVKSQELAKAELVTKEDKLQEMAKQVAELTKICDKVKEQNADKEQDNQEKSKLLEQLQKQLSVSETRAKELDARLTVVEEERNKLKQHVQTLQTVKTEKQEMEAQLSSVTKQVQEMQQRKVMDDVETETTALKNALEKHTLLLNNKDVEIEKLRNEAKIIQGENSLLKSQTSTLKALEKEKKSLEHRIQQLESSLAESQANANIMANLDSSDPVVAKLKEDKESAEAQVQFLNSVIVDLQRKIDNLKTRLEAMEAGVVNGDTDVAMDISESRMIAPRMFCDICEVFDLHDTDDCPKQAMSDSPPVSQYHGNRSDERPYCDICEVFGHWTANCDDEQTF